MKLVPVVKIVQTHPVSWSGGVIGHAARAQNTASRFVIMIVTAHRGVMLRDRVPRQGFGVFLHPGFEFGISRLVLLDEILYRLLLESERSKGHRIEAFADVRIAGSKFTRGLQRDLLPKAREVHNAKWTGIAGTD